MITFGLTACTVTLQVAVLPGLRVEAVYKNGEKVLNKNQYAISQFQTQKIGTFKAIVS